MIQIKNIVKDYKMGDNIVHALKDISINFRENEFVSILGQSGCGKTTLLNVLGGLDKYDSGEININNKSTKEFKDSDWDWYRNHYIGFIFQSYNLIPHLTILENVEIALSIAGISKKSKRQKATEALTKVGLSQHLNKRPNQLSGGQMQRVAIARAIVNNPKIILADEPTGALDSETSIQIMDLLQEISKDHLIIMVTHNKELAEQYSTRIINLLDGKIVGDSNPFTPQNIKIEHIKKQSQLTKEEKKVEKSKKKQKNKSQMRFFTAMNLSLKNLLTKKGRTFLTSFAGSIGIIGIALILAVSNGFSMYVDKIQSDTLAGYPLTVSSFVVDTEALQNAAVGVYDNKGEDFSSTTQIHIKQPLLDPSKFTKYNFISPEFIDYVKQIEEEDKKLPPREKTINQVQYSYASRLNVITKNGDKIVKVKTTPQVNPMLGTETLAFTEGISNDEFVKSQYNVIFGEYPKEKNEVALVISRKNTITSSVANALGINLKTDPNTGKFVPIDFKTICGANGKEFKVLLNDTYYKPNYNGETITNFNELNFEDSSLSNEEKLAIYNDNKNITLKISGILRIKDDSPIDLYDSGIIYSQELTSYVNELNKNCKIEQETIKTKTFYKPYETNGKTFHNTAELINFVNTSFKYNLTENQALNYGLQMLGTSTIPTNIKIYPKNFSGKDKVVQKISEWNAKEENVNNQIFINDATKFLSDTMGQIVNIISYVLIAFASISLIVSSIMIAIITYVSVIERTKEIGVLRSIGARKKDISRVFNAETLIIGLFSGFLGVFISWVLTFPISALIKNIAGGSITGSMAVLSPISALVLIAISVVLTLLSGYIPSKIAAKKDPVKALRSE